MRLRVARRVAGEGKCIATYVKFLEDLGCGEQAGRAREIKVLEAGFLDYRMVRVSLGVPPPGDKLQTDLASAELCAALADGLGVDPRMLSGRLALLVDLEDDSGKTIAGLRDRGYTVTIDGVKAIS
ncbi:MAG TPA: hypothetical protein VLL69_17935 [Streptosporangiaceae bacterium]|nr:hypothetical protein [Streptosporangiaceae bacterium]